MDIKNLARHGEPSSSVALLEESRLATAYQYLFNVGISPSPCVLAYSNSFLCTLEVLAKLGEEYALCCLVVGVAEDRREDFAEECLAVIVQREDKAIAAFRLEHIEIEKGEIGDEFAILRRNCILPLLDVCNRLGSQ